MRSFRRSFRRSGMQRRRAFSSAIQRTPITADATYIKLRWSTQTKVTGGTTVDSVYTFRGNSVYDPDYSLGAGSKSPLGFAEYMAFYNYATVMGSKIRVKMFNETDVACIAAVYPNLTTTGDSNQDNLREIPYAKCNFMGLGGKAGNQAVWLKNYMSTTRMFQISPQEVKDNELYHHSSSGNPTNVWYWHVHVQPAAVTTSIVTYMEVTIDYYVQFKRRVPLVV